MADKRADRQEDLKQDKPGTDKTRWFINEKIVRQPLSKRQIARSILLTAFCAVLFGVLSAVCFVVTQPLAQRALGQEPSETSSQITIPKDEPETTQPVTEAVTETEAPQETEPVGEVVQAEMEKYQYSVEDLDKLYNNLRTIASDADNSIVAVHSIQHEKDWFDNPIETTGQFSGVVVAKTQGEALILVPEAAVEVADSIEVAFSNGMLMEGAVKQSDTIMGLAVVSVDVSQIDSGQYEKIEAIELGNSYGVKQGDLVVAVGAPAGIVHSSSYGFISYVIRNVQMVDGSLRVFYMDAQGNADAGTFILNTSGQLIGWATDKYTEDGECAMTTVASVSDYKGVLELLSNGIAVPYFGIRGQEVSQTMADSGMPKGIYITDSVSDSPAYNAGIQPGDILTWMNGTEIKNMKDFQNQVEKFRFGDKIQVAVLRSNGKDEYKEIEYQVTIGAR